jgi:hypothetical protein
VRYKVKQPERLADATERLREDLYGNDSQGLIDLDLSAVADAYLHLTDPTPIDEAWLVQLGFYGKGSSSWTHQDIGFYLTRVEGGWCVFVEVYDLGRLTTRGQLRMLASALEIELKE